MVPLLVCISIVHDGVLVHASHRLVRSVTALRPERRRTPRMRGADIPDVSIVHPIPFIISSNSDGRSVTAGTARGRPLGLPSCTRGRVRHSHRILRIVGVRRDRGRLPAEDLVRLTQGQPDPHALLSVGFPISTAIVRDVERIEPCTLFIKFL